MALIAEEKLEQSEGNFINRYNSEPYSNSNISNNYNRININKNYNRTNSGKYNNTKLTSFYGQSKVPNGPAPNPNLIPNMGEVSLRVSSKGIPQVPQQHMMYPSFGIGMPNSNMNYQNYVPQNNMRPNSNQNLPLNQANNNQIEGGKVDTN